MRFSGTASMRKSLAYLFLILANITLMAHHAIPHHHHHGYVCTLNAHCQSGENHSGGHAHHDEGHDHDGGPLSTHCILKQDIIRPHNNWKPDADPDPVPTGHVPGVAMVLTNAPLPESIIRNPGCLFLHEKTLSNYTLFASVSGLRAPPQV